NNRHLDPQQAEKEAEVYTVYFRDVIRMKLGCSVMAEVTAAEVCKTRQANEDKKETRIFLFGIGGKYSEMDLMFFPSSPNEHDGVGSTVWNRIPSIEGWVDEVIGAAPYATDNGSHIYLFFRQDKKGKRTLKFTKYDLDSPLGQNGWSGDYELDLPDEAET